MKLSVLGLLYMHEAFSFENIIHSQRFEHPGTCIHVQRFQFRKKYTLPHFSASYMYPLPMLSILRPIYFSITFSGPLLYTYSAVDFETDTHVRVFGLGHMNFSRLWILEKYIFQSFYITFLYNQPQYSLSAITYLAIVGNLDHVWLALRSTMNVSCFSWPTCHWQPLRFCKCGRAYLKYDGPHLISHLRTYTLWLQALRLNNGCFICQTWWPRDLCPPPAQVSVA